MFIQPPTPATRRRCSRQGWTLMEMMVALACGIIIMGSIVVTGITMSNTMSAIGNYVDLNTTSRYTLDIMSRDLRDTAVVTSLSDSRIVVTNVINGDLVSYNWNGTDKFTRTKNGVSTVLLTGCDTLVFKGYQRNPTNGFNFLPASTPTQTKLVSVSWRCSRQIFGFKLNTESVQTAQICIRN